MSPTFSIIHCHFPCTPCRNVVPRLTLYLCLRHEQIYHALYLENVTSATLTHKLATLMQISRERIHDVYLQGPSGIHILVTDEVRPWSICSVERHTSHRPSEGVLIKA